MGVAGDAQVPLPAIMSSSSPTVRGDCVHGCAVSRDELSDVLLWTAIS
jgi:hypothetical protein